MNQFRRLSLIVAAVLLLFSCERPVHTQGTPIPCPQDITVKMPQTYGNKDQDRTSSDLLESLAGYRPMAFEMNGISILYIPDAKMSGSKVSVSHNFYRLVGGKLKEVKFAEKERPKAMGGMFLDKRFAETGE
ncbi:MAG: hypothetical protein AAFY71_26365 [Bacteroidota bacterium]